MSEACFLVCISDLGSAHLKKRLSCAKRQDKRYAAFMVRLINQSVNEFIRH